jgi:hypothetical protein
MNAPLLDKAVRTGRARAADADRVEKISDRSLRLLRLSASASNEGSARNGHSPVRAAENSAHLDCPPLGCGERRHLPDQVLF